MNKSEDEIQIRRLIQRVKRHDESQIPAFDGVLNRTLVKPRRQSNRVIAVTLALATTVALLLIVLLFANSDATQNTPKHIVENNQDSNTERNERPSAVRNHFEELDFSTLRQVVDDYFAVDSATNRQPLSVWSSETESLLALNLDF